MKLLIVEDVPPARTKCEQLATTIGHQSKFVRLPIDALDDVAPQWRPNFVLMDILYDTIVDPTPQQRKVAAIDAAHLIYLRFDIPVIFYTGHPTLVASDTIRKAFGIIEKPLTNAAQLSCAITIADKAHDDLKNQLRFSLNENLRFTALSRSAEMETGYSLAIPPNGDVWPDSSKAIFAAFKKAAGSKKTSKVGDKTVMDDVEITTRRGNVKKVKLSIQLLFDRYKHVGFRCVAD
jgi:DNA-binding NtrC family response regulator